MAEGKRIAAGTAWNALGQIAPAAAAFFAIPVLISGLGVERFGVLSLVWVFVGYVGLFDLGLGRALTQLIAKKVGKGDTADLPELVWTGVSMMLGVGVVAGVAVGAAAPLLADHVLEIPGRFREETTTSLFYVALSAPIITLTAAFRGILEARYRFDMINQVRIPMGIFTFAGPVLVLPFRATLPPIVLVLLLSRLTALAINVWQCRRADPGLFARRRPDRRMMRPLLRFGGWMTLSNLISPLMVNMDRFFIASILSVSAVSYYVTPFEIVTRLLVVPGAYVGVLFPHFGTSLARDPSSARATYRRAVWHVAALLGPAVLAIVLLARWGLGVWIGSPDFVHHAVAPARILAIGVLANGLAAVPFALIQAAGRPDVTAKMHLAEVVVYLPILYLLTLKLGIVGVALAWVVRVSLDAALLFTYARRVLATAETLGR